jgi:hypothetical protein
MPARQRRPPDPTIVPVQARAPSKQTPKVAVNPKTGEEDGEGGGEGPMIGPSMGEGGVAVSTGRSHLRVVRVIQRYTVIRRKMSRM